MSIIESLNWRAAIKKFDPEQKLNAEQIEQLLEAANLTATSGGLQPFKIVVVQNEELQGKLAEASYGQRQVADASHVLVIATLADLDESIVDVYIKRAAEVRNQDIESLQGYSNSMRAYVSSMGDAGRKAWAKNQAFIALGTLMAAAAELRIDSCPMEGFDPGQYQEILGLEGLQPVAILPVGVRSGDDVHSTEAKIRKTREDFVVEVA